MSDAALGLALTLRDRAPLRPAQPQTCCTISVYCAAPPIGSQPTSQYCTWPTSRAPAHLPLNLTAFQPSSAFRVGLTRRLMYIEKALGESKVMPAFPR
jgi:hypothetical protein